MNQAASPAAPIVAMSSGPAQQITANAPAMIAIEVVGASFITDSALGSGWIARIRGRGRKSLHVGFRVVIGHDRGLVPERYDHLANARYCLQALPHGARTRCAIHILHSECHGSFCCKS